MNFDYQTAVVAPFRMQPGLRRLAPSGQHLTPLPPGGRPQREKLAVLSAFAHEALVCVPGFDAMPALARLSEQAAREHPESFGWDRRTATATSKTLGVAVQAGQVQDIGAGTFGLGDEIGRCLAGLPPAWRLTGLLALCFAQDVAVVQGDTGRVPWMAVALPSHWDPAEKVGRHFNEIHAPVADPQSLLAAGERLMKMVCGPESFERFVWNVTGHPRLHAHPARVDPVRWPQAAETDFTHQAWWRTERQTFLPVPEAGQAVFTIEVDVQPLGEVIQSAAQAQALHDALHSMSDAVLAYRNLVPVRQALLEWLGRVAGNTPAPEIPQSAAQTSAR